MKKIYQILFAKTAFLAILFSSAGHAQDVYTVESIPHHVFATDMDVQFTSDDLYSQIIDLPFDFNFFGNTYSQIIVGTNGEVLFDISYAGLGSGWAFTETIPDPEFNWTNVILGCFHDMNAQQDDDGQASITWSVTGDAPFRQFVIMYNEQPAFSCGIEAKSSFQIIIYETFNYIDSQIIKREVCLDWNSGNAVIGIINAAGDIAFTPPGRNTGTWAITTPEGWRFRPETDPVYRYIMCDAGLDGLETFDLAVVQGDLDPSAVFYETMEDAALAQNAIPLTGYTNTNPYNQTIYAAYNGQIIEVLLSAIDCSLGYDNDTVASNLEDVNADGNLGNDDTDGDGLPDFLDNDDDGDQMLTFEEYVFIVGPPDGNDGEILLDTDGDGVVNYLDNDDDGDGVLTINEDANCNANLTDDDTDGNGTPDFLDLDDDGDGVLTMDETGDTDNDTIPNPLDNDDDNDGILTSGEDLNGNGDLSDEDTDGNGIANYLDSDDDGDGIPTINEDYDQNGNPTDDDVNANGTPDYLEAPTAGVAGHTLQNSILLYPNPAADILNIDNRTGREITGVSVYAVNGVLVKQAAAAGAIRVADLQNGVYIVKVQVDGQVLNYKFIKQ